MDVQSQCPVCGFETLTDAQSAIRLNGEEFSLFKDFLHESGKVPILASLPFELRVKYLEERAKLILLEPLEELIYLINRNVTKKYHLLNILTLICCCIEALGHYLLPKKIRKENKKVHASPRDYFKKFVKVFMNEDFQKKCGKTERKYSDFIYNVFRSGLAHGFCVERGGITKATGIYFNYDMGKDTLILDIDCLIEDFREVFSEFFKTLYSGGSAGTYGVTFENRFKQLILTR